MRAGNIRRMHGHREYPKTESRMPKSRMVEPRSVTYWNATPFIPASYWNPEWRGKLEIAVPFLALLIDNTGNMGAKMQICIRKTEIHTTQHNVKFSQNIAIFEKSYFSVHAFGETVLAVHGPLNRIGSGPSNAVHASHVKARTTPGLY